MIVISGSPGPFPFRIEEWSPLGRHLYVLAFVLEPRPAIEAFVATLYWRAGEELRLRRYAQPQTADYREMNFGIFEWGDAGPEIATHGLFLSVLPARAAYAAVLAARPDSRITLQHHGRVLER